MREAAAKAKAKTVLASELAKMKKSYSDNKKSMEKKQAQYDKETKHGIIEKKQTEWEEKISEGFWRILSWPLNNAGFSSYGPSMCFPKSR